MKNAIKESLPPISGDLGGIVARWDNASTVGSCNFCSCCENEKVLSISGGRLLVRMCEDCYKRLKLMADDK